MFRYGAEACWSRVWERAHTSRCRRLIIFRLPGDVSASKRYWKEDIIEPEVEVSSEGIIAVSDAPGTGYRVREDFIQKLRSAGNPSGGKDLVGALLRHPASGEVLGKHSFFFSSISTAWAKVMSFGTCLKSLNTSVMLKTRLLTSRTFPVISNFIDEMAQ